MQLFRVELAGQGEKAVARLGQLVAWIVVIYAGLTFCCGVLYWLLDMSLFDAVNHAMTTVATGGFSTHDESFGFFDDARIETVAVVFMILGSLPLVLYLQILLGRGMRFLLDEQVRWFLPILLFVVAVAFFPLASAAALADRLVKFAQPVQALMHDSSHPLHKERHNSKPVVAGDVQARSTR